MRLALRREALSLGVAASLAAHALVARALREAPPFVGRDPLPMVELDDLPPRPAEPRREDPRPSPRRDEVRERAPTSPASPVAAPRAPTRERRPSPTEPPLLAPTPLSLPGVTLSGDDGAWDAALGSGERITNHPSARRAAPPRYVPHGAAAPPARPPAPPRAREVALGDLSERPRAPALDGALRRHYPASAREQQVSGHAAVRVRIGPTGSVTTMSVVSESFPGFGSACQSALRGTSWTPPRDEAGRAVATWILYRCHFQLTN